MTRAKASLRNDCHLKTKTEDLRPENKDPKTKIRKQRPENEDPKTKTRKRRPCRNLENVHNEASLWVLSFGRKPSIRKKTLKLLLYYLHSFNSLTHYFFIYNDIYVNFSTFGNNDTKLSKRHLVFLSLISKFKADKENEERKGGLRFRVFVFGSSFSGLRSSFSQQPRLRLDTSASVSFRSGNKSPRLLSHGKIKGTTLPATLNALTAAGALRILIDFTLSNARRFYLSVGNLLAVKGLTAK